MSASMGDQPQSVNVPTALRVLLIGLPGAGKSTLSHTLQKRFGLPHFEIDEFRRQHADGTIAGDCFARAYFLRACGTQPRGIFEFSAVGVYRYDTANALREYPAPLLTIWVDAPYALREERLARRGGRLPWPRYRLDVTQEEIEAKGHAVLQKDQECGFWTKGPGWQAHRLDTGRALNEATGELLGLVEEFISTDTPRT